MMKLRNIFLLLFLCCAGAAHAQEQESMMPFVDYAFLEKLVVLAKDHYPRMKKYEHTLEKQKMAIKRAQMSWFDGLSLGYVYTATNTTATAGGGTTGAFAPGIYFNIGTLLEKSPNIKMAKEDMAIAQEDLAEYNKTLDALVRNRYYIYVQKQAIVNLRTMASNDAESTQKQIKYKFQKGEESFENYSKALVMFSVSTQNKIEAEGAMLIAKTDLEELIGCKLEDVK